MTNIPLTPETEALARRIIWFESPAEALAHPIRFIAHAFEHATHEDMTILRRHVSEAELRLALAAAPPGIIGARSWHYWHAVYGEFPPPAMPDRVVP
jgi:hypothetical protein